MISDDVAYRVDGAALFAESARVRRRGGWFLAVGVPLTLFGLLLGLMVLVTVLRRSFASAESGEGLAAGLVVVACFLPLLIGVALVVAGARRLSLASRLRDLSSLAHGTTQVTVLGLSARTGKTPADVMSLLGTGRRHRAATREGAAKVPTAPVDGARLAAISRTLLVRGVTSALMSLPVALFTIIATVLILVGFIGTGDWMTHLTGVIVFIGGSVMPGWLTVWLALRARRCFRERDRLQALAAALGSGARTFDELGAALRVTPSDVETSLQDAMESYGLFTPTPFGQAVAPSMMPPAAGDAFAPTRPRGADPHASWVGRIIRGTYLIEASLGHGGMGVVFRARHLVAGTKHALKVLLLDRYDSPDVLKRFEREATLSRGLGHPGLVRVDDFGTSEDGTPFLVMELIEGETLEERLARRGTLDWPEAKTIALAVGSALSAAHGAGFLHRDVKPSNIMLARDANGDERPVLVDFGLAKRVDASALSKVTTTGAVIGTPLYMSPEQARGEPLDERSDLYGLAVVVYEMVAGVPPFFDKTLAQVYARLLTDEAPALSAFAPDKSNAALDTVLARALATRREERFRTVAEWMHAIESVG